MMNLNFNCVYFLHIMFIFYHATNEKSMTKLDNMHYLKEDFCECYTKMMNGCSPVGCLILRGLGIHPRSIKRGGEKSILKVDDGFQEKQSQPSERSLTKTL